jgi:pimeloyl-ACP methyl ester carboxylesterase
VCDLGNIAGVSVLRAVPEPSVIDGVNYTVTGDGAHTLVLLHGFADNLTTWNRVVPPLAVNHRVIAIDLPGFGGTTRAWRDPLFADYVEVVQAVLEAEGVTGPVSLMGNSMGAVVSALFAARYPERCDGVVLIDMPGLHAVPRMWRLAMSRPAELGVRTALRWVPDGVAQFGLGWAYSHIAAAHPRRLAPDVRIGFTTPYAAHGKVSALLPLGRVLLRELRTANLAGIVARTTVPVLLVFGSRDVLTPARVLRRLGRPGGAVVLPGCGHCPQIDQPEALLDPVVPFLREAAGAQAGRIAGAATA